MKKKKKITIKILKSLAIIILIFSMLNGVFAQVVSDADENAFITKADLNTLKKAYQTKLTNLYANVDKNIDNIEIEYLRKYVKGTTPNVCQYPIGAIYISTTGINPGEQIGGTWEEFGKGKTLIGYQSSDTAFNTVLKTGGAKTRTMAYNNLPSHTHTYGSSNISAYSTEEGGNHYHQFSAYWTNVDNTTEGVGTYQWDSEGSTYKTSAAGTHDHKYYPKGELSKTGNSQAFDIMQPYYVVSFWRRVA